MATRKSEPDVNGAWDLLEGEITRHEEQLRRSAADCLLEGKDEETDRLRASAKAVKEVAEKIRGVRRRWDALSAPNGSRKPRRRKSNPGHWHYRWRRTGDAAWGPVARNGKEAMKRLALERLPEGPPAGTGVRWRWQLDVGEAEDRWEKIPGERPWWLYTNLSSPDTRKVLLELVEAKPGIEIEGRDPTTETWGRLGAG